MEGTFEWDLVGKQINKVVQGGTKQVESGLDNKTTSMLSHRTPLGLGNEKMPVREDVVEPLCHGHSIGSRSHTRKRRFGNIVEEENDKPEETSIPEPSCCGKYGVEFCRTKMDEDTMRRMAVILPQLQAAAVALKDEKHVPMILVEGINPGAVEQKAQAVLLRVFVLQEPTVRE